MSVPLHSGQLVGNAAAAIAANTRTFADEAEHEAFMMRKLEDEDAFHSGMRVGVAFFCMFLFSAIWCGCMLVCSVI